MKTISKRKLTWLMLTIVLLASISTAPLIAKTTTPTTTKLTTAPIKFVTATVTKIVDGDTIDVSISKKTYRVRLIGVNTPETKDPRKPVEYYGKEASDYTTKCLSKKMVYLQYDVGGKDKYGRLLAYLWLTKPAAINDKTIRANMFNANLLLNGYAQLMTIPPDVKYVDFLKKYEKEARNAKKGLWGKKSTTTTTVKKVVTTTTATVHKSAPTTTTTQTSYTAPSSGGDTTVYITDTGSKYHRAGCRYLKSSCISISLSDAISQGYGPCSVCKPPTE